MIIEWFHIQMDLAGEYSIKEVVQEEYVDLQLEIVLLPIIELYLVEVFLMMVIMEGTLLQ